MAGLVPAIHVLYWATTWVPGNSAGAKKVMPLFAPHFRCG